MAGWEEGWGEGEDVGVEGGECFLGWGGHCVGGVGWGWGSRWGRGWGVGMIIVDVMIFWM